MSERVDAQRIGPLDYAVSVHEGQDTTHHKVRMSPTFLDDLLVDDAAPERVATETVRYLLDREPGVAIPAEVELDWLGNHDQDFLPELRARLLD